MRDDLENIYMLLFRFVESGFQLALCNVGWLATQESVVFVPDPIVFAPWSVLVDRGEPCDNCQDTSDEVAFFGDRQERRPPATHRRLEVVCSVPHIAAVDSSPRRGVVPFFLSHTLSPVHRQGDLGDEADGMKGDTIKLRSDDDGNRKRGVPCGHLARQSSFSGCLFLNLSDGEASFGDGADCVSSFDETVQMLSHAGALEKGCGFLFLLK